MPNQNNNDNDILAEMFDNQVEQSAEFKPLEPLSHVDEPIRIAVEEPSNQPRPINNWHNQRQTVGLQSSAIER
ncbi:hypothetical protein EOM71_00920, partial [Candidatus Falkowbacteria bacterium]|nr:hypothetical protein [Candidatus Falkowbacteria bacterium]